MVIAHSIVKLKRVAYSKTNTLDEDKEYQIFDSGLFSTVRTLKEWKNYFPNAKIICVDKDGTKREL